MPAFNSPTERVEAKEMKSGRGRKVRNQHLKDRQPPLLLDLCGLLYESSSWGLLLFPLCLVESCPNLLPSFLGDSHHTPTLSYPNRSTSILCRDRLREVERSQLHCMSRTDVET